MFSSSRQPDAAVPRFGRKVSRFRKRSPVTVIDFDGSHVRIVQASPQGDGARITHLASVKWTIPEGKPNPEAKGQALRKALEEARVKVREAILALPRAQVVLRPLQVPMVAEVQELSSVVNFQITKDLPFRLEDAVVDYKVLRALEGGPAPAEPLSEPGTDAATPATGEAEHAAQGRLEVLVGAIRKEQLEFLEGVARAAGIKLAGLALRSTGIARVMAQFSPSEPEGASAVVSVREDEVTFEVIEQNGLVFSRVAGIPPSLPGESEEAREEGAAEAREQFLGRLGMEVVRSLHSYEGMMGHKPVKRMLVVGGTGLEPAIVELLGERTSIPVELLDPSKWISKKGIPAGETSPCFAAIGLAYAALQSAGLPLDFVNPKRPAVRRDTRRIKILASVVGIAAVLFALLAIRANLVGKRIEIRDAAQLELTAAKQKQKIYRATVLRARAVQGWLAQDQEWLDHLACISSILPGADQVYVSALTVTPQHVIRMSVQARSGEILSELDKKLRSAGYEVKPLSITPANDKHGYYFRTTVELVIPKGMKPEFKDLKAPPRPADDTPPPTALHQSAPEGGLAS